IKREVIEKIGLLEESFGSGNYEDDDFCLRAELAGYKAAIVKDSFIHHFGSVSFTADGVSNYVEKLSQNSDKFYQKWKDLDKPSLMWSIFLFNKAKEEKEKGNIDFALELYEKVFLQRPEEKLLIEEYTGLLLETGLVEKAMDKLEKYLEKQPEDHEGWNFLGTLYLNEGQVEKAYQAFQKAVQLYDKNLDYFRNLVDVALLLDDFETATTGLEYILARIPGDKEASLKMAHLMMEAGETNKAKEFLSFAMEQNPEDQQLQFYLKKTSSPMLYLTYAFIEGQRYDLAFEAVEQFLNEHPDDVEALSLKASILFYYQQFDEAEKIYGHILEIEPEHPEARYYLMKLYRMVGKNKELKELLNSVQEGIEKDAPYLQEMIMSLIELEEFEQALKHIEAYIGKFPEDYFGYWIMGNLYREMEDTDKALRFYHSAL
ncbi:MAG: tetratricopeptide repeat protein, partial [Methanobacteriota archaeon]